MKFSLPAIAAALLAFALAGCGPARVKGPDPNLVGQWQWSNKALGSWRMELKADGTFEREVVGPFDPKPAIVSGRWSLRVTPSEPSWLERHGIFQNNSDDDEWMRSAGVNPANKAIHWSAPGTLTFLYDVPPGTGLAPGAVWTGGTMAIPAGNAAPTSPQPQMGIEEKHTVRTHTDTNSGEDFLDLAGKVFEKPGNSGTAKALLDGGRTPSGEIPQTAGSAAATTEAPDFIPVEPFVGITLDVPGNWLGTDPNSVEKLHTPVIEAVSKPRMPNINSAWRYVPPGDVQDVYVFVGVQPVIFSPKQLADTSNINLDRFAAGFVKGASQGLEAKGYYLRPNVSADYATFGKRTAVVCTGEMVDPVGNTRTLRAVGIPTESATVVLVCCWDAEPGAHWKTIIERAYSSFRVADTFRVPSP